MKIPKNRKGFKIIVPKVDIIENWENFLPHSACIVYGQSKMTHSGLTCWKTFEGFQRKMKKNSIDNLLNQINKENGSSTDETQLRKNRKLNEKQSRQVKSYANKLCYYSQVRHFCSQKTGSYKFKVAFLTLTAPGTASSEQVLKAFEHFLDYLRRTANCHYLWKKELGEEGKKLHLHILINNFIPYYVVSWKWKRCLLQEGVKWTQNDKGKDTDSHYRIELPRSRKLIAHYISKYMSKTYELPREYGYVTGHSEILEQLKEPKWIESELPKDEILTIQANYKTIRDQFLSHTCVDIRTVQKIAPTLYFWFMKQFYEFQERITLPQKYWYT
jgi:hypothetical protein